jgi:3-dehydroquinate synthase
MQTITVRTESRSSRILIGEKLENLINYLPAEKGIIITDGNIMRLYGHRLPPLPVIEIGTGESMKTMDTLNHIFSQLVAFEADRSTFIIAIGGGIVCDVAGFAASVYMRGLRFGFVSTTLLSQVDASVGGKNGVNFLGYKNMIGVFAQPEFVICDTSVLSTLDPREFRAGFAEIIKAGAIRSEALFSYLEEHASEALACSADVLDKIIFDAVSIKASVVEADEREAGERKILNFGHTFAHALEHLTGILHGEAVGIGMVLASALSVKTGFLRQEDADRITRLLERYGLPLHSGINTSALLDAMKKDKKREGDSVHLILLSRIGQALIHKTTYSQLENLTHDLR